MRQRFLRVCPVALRAQDSAALHLPYCRYGCNCLLLLPSRLFNDRKSSAHLPSSLSRWTPCDPEKNSASGVSLDSNYVARPALSSSSASIFNVRLLSSQFLDRRLVDSTIDKRQMLIGGYTKLEDVSLVYLHLFAHLRRNSQVQRTTSMMRSRLHCVRSHQSCIS